MVAKREKIFRIRVPCYQLLDLMEEGVGSWERGKRLPHFSRRFYIGSRTSLSRAIMANFQIQQEIEGEWRSTKTVEIMGLRIPAYFTTDPQLLHDYIANFQTKSDDVFVVSYPKSGKKFERRCMRHQHGALQLFTEIQIDMGYKISLVIYNAGSGKIASKTAKFDRGR